MDFLNAIELTHLRYFVAVAEELHFGRASARLHMAQPPLTRQIKLLEQRLGCLLFERTSRSTRLTTAGAELLDRSRGVLQAAERAFGAVQELGAGGAGQLTLATAPSLMLGPLPHWIRSFRKRYPAVTFRLDEMATSAILDAVETGVADLGLIRGLDKHAGIETLLRTKEPMVAILPRDFAAPEPLTAAHLKDEPFVFFPRHLGPSFYDEVIRHCRRAGCTPRIAQEARQWSSVMSLVSAGTGVSIGPASIAELMPKAVNCAPLQGFHTTVRLVARKGTSNVAAGNFLKILKGNQATPSRYNQTRI